MHCVDEVLCVAVARGVVVAVGAFVCLFVCLPFVYFDLDSERWQCTELHLFFLFFWSTSDYCFIMFRLLSGMHTFLVLACPVFSRYMYYPLHGEPVWPSGKALGW